MKGEWVNDELADRHAANVERDKAGPEQIPAPAPQGARSWMPVTQPLTPQNAIDSARLLHAPEEAVARYEMAVAVLTELLSVKNEARDEVMAQVADALKAIDDEYATRIEAAEKTVQITGEAAKATALQEGRTIKGATVDFRYVGASKRASWDTRGLKGYAAGGHQEVLQFLTETDVPARVEVRERGGAK